MLLPPGDWVRGIKPRDARTRFLPAARAACIAPAWLDKRWKAADFDETAAPLAGSRSGKTPGQFRVKP